MNMESLDFSKLVVPGITGLRAFKPPVEPQNLSNIVKLDSNESLLGPSPVAVDAIVALAKDAHYYPDTAGQPLRSQLAQHTNADPDGITLGNGSNDVLDIITRALCSPGDEIVFSQYAFAVYPILAAIVGAKAVQVPADVNYGHDLAAMAAAVTSKTKLIFIANPNNPTGTWNSIEQIETFIAGVPRHVIVVLDEAYIEYCNTETFPNGLNYLSRYPNLIVTRTFSKAWGLAAMRVGYAISDPILADYFNRVRQPFNVNRLALAAASAALTDVDHLEKVVSLTHSGMAQITEQLIDRGMDYIPSKGNFVCVNVGDAMQTTMALRAKDVLVTPLSNYGLSEFIRITIGKESENTIALDAIYSHLEMTVS